MWWASFNQLKALRAKTRFHGEETLTQVQNPEILPELPPSQPTDFSLRLNINCCLSFQTDSLPYKCQTCLPITNRSLHLSSTYLSTERDYSKSLSIDKQMIDVQTHFLRYRYLDYTQIQIFSIYIQREGDSSIIHVYFQKFLPQDLKLEPMSLTPIDSSSAL